MSVAAWPAHAGEGGFTARSTVGSIALEAGRKTVSEGDVQTQVPVTAKLVSGIVASADIDVTVSVNGSGNAEAVDWEPIGDFVITIPQGAVSAAGTFLLTPENDRLDEADETLTVSGAATLPVASTSLLLEDDEPLPIVNVRALNESAEPGRLDFSIFLDGPSGREVKVQYSTTNHIYGTGGPGSYRLASVGADFDIEKGRMVFQPGETRKTVSVNVRDDAIDEPVEIVLFSIYWAANARTVFRYNSQDPLCRKYSYCDDGSSDGVACCDCGIIRDDDPPVEVVLYDARAREGAHILNFNLRLSARTEKTVLFELQTSDVTAEAGNDYFPIVNGQSWWSTESLDGKLSVPLMDDNTVETDETFRLSVSNSANQIVIKRGTATGTILDDDSGPRLSVAGVSGNEGETLDFVVRTSFASEAALTVDYETSNRAAESGRDYRAVQGTLTFAPGESRRTVSVATVDDVLEEPAETFALTLSSPTNGRLGVSRAEGMIFDNDLARVVLTTSPASVAERAGPTAVQVTATLEGALRSTATAVRVSVRGGSAEETRDFAAVPDFDIRIAPEASSGAGTFTLSPVDDNRQEADEALTISGVSDRTVEAAALSLLDGGERPLETFRVLLFESASNPLRQGFLRVINNSPISGEVVIEATDDSGDRRGPVTLFIEPGHAAHFNSIDLEEGNPAKHLSGGVGTPIQGDWHLKMSTSLDVDVLAYSRTKDALASTADAFVTTMNEVAPIVDGKYRVPFFNPGTNQAQQSILRLINIGPEDVEATVAGIDDAGWASDVVRVSVPRLETVTLTAEELETGVAAGIVGGKLGRGTGKWRLTVSANPTLVAKALLLSADKLTNLSSSRYVRTVPIFPSMSERDWTGMLRVINRSPEAGEVTIVATDEMGRDYQPVVLTLGGLAAAQFNSADLELGNPGKGLIGSTGAGLGNWCLELLSSLDVHAVAYARSHDGFLTSIHDLLPQENGVHRANFFNPASNDKQVSWLHLLSDSDADALVTITGKDDRGNSPGSPVWLRIPAGTVVRLPSAALESGEHELIESGALGDGTGKWRLEVKSDRPIEATSLLVSPSGHLSNVSTAVDPYDATRPESGSGG